MKIKSLNIKNFKSIVDITINEPNPFTVLVGPNGSGKSNIFEALEFIKHSNYPRNSSTDLFGGESFFLNKKFSNKKFSSKIVFFGPYTINTDFREFNFINDGSTYYEYFSQTLFTTEERTDDIFLGFSNVYSQFSKNYSRVFVKNIEKQKINSSGNSSLNFSASNLEKVLKRLLENKEKREEISDWLSLFIPEFDRIEVQKSQFSSNEDLLIYQKHYDRPFNKELISDGTYNIIALLTAVYQSDEPQFLCIEEPENGLHPFVIRKLVDFFRQACEDKGHYIWLNTHSQTLVECLTADEVIVVDKVEGETNITQLKGTNLHGLDMAEYWLSGATGGGTPW